MQNILTLETTKYAIKLQNFEGPLDLLCHLIDKNKMDICDIKISEITDQYIEYINTMEQMNLEITSEFIFMASTLLYLKSKHLLPSGEEEEKEISEEELIRRIIEYKKYKEMLNIKANSCEDLITSLSGGNQQKVFLARWLNTDAEILLLDNPTQGIDVGAKAEIYKLILELAKQGKTILINTLEIPEIQKVADYCAVFYNGEIIKVLEHQEIDEMTVMMYSTNAAQAEEGK